MKYIKELKQSLLQGILDGIGLIIFLGIIYLIFTIISFII